MLTDRITAPLLRRGRALVLGSAFLLGSLSFAAGWGTGLDRSLRDALRSRPASGEIHIVEIDSRSLERIHRWPLPRSVHAAAVDRLHAAGARVIAFDVDFSADSDPLQDARFAASLKRAGGSVVLPTFRQYEGSGSYKFRENVPIKILADHAFLGSVNVAPDPDGYVRSMLTGVATLGTPRPSLPSLLAEAQSAIGRSFDIDYAIEPSTIPRHSLVDLIEGRIPAAALAGKRIVIGATAIEMGDRYPVPRHGVIPGVLVQALAGETLLGGRVPVRYSAAVPLALMLLLLAGALRLRSRKLKIAGFGAGLTLVTLLPLATEAWLAASTTLAPALIAAGAAALAGSAVLLAERSRTDRLIDPDTGLPNLRALEAAVAPMHGATVVVARIERFNAIAAGLGAEAAGRLVQRVADRLRLANGQRPIYRTDEAALAWVEQPGEESTLDERFEAVMALMRAPIESGRLVDVSLSFGVAVGEGREAKQLVANAGLAAARAIQAKSRWAWFSASDSEESARQISILGDLDAALGSGQIWNAYQAKLDLASGRIVAAEALVRWDHPERGLIRPDDFIPLVEEAGRMRELTAYVLDQALEDALAWDAAGFELGIAVNVSASLLTDHAFIEEVGRLIQTSRLPSERVTIEVTESATMASPERAIAALESWRALGVGISIDDYGTGQSSLGYLQKLPATELKIDKSFVQTLGEDRRNAIMVRSTVEMAHELGIKVVAEGIEDAECLAMLADMGCDTGQGYYISKPIAAGAVADLLRNRERKAA